jgi:hypothetical protein
MQQTGLWVANRTSDFHEGGPRAVHSTFRKPTRAHPEKLGRFLRSEQPFRPYRIVHSAAPQRLRRDRIRSCDEDHPSWAGIWSSGLIAKGYSNCRRCWLRMLSLMTLPTHSLVGFSVLIHSLSLLSFLDAAQNHSISIC